MMFHLPWVAALGGTRIRSSWIDLLLAMNGRVPFCDLTRANRTLCAELNQAISRVVDRGWFLRGPETAAFEAEWATYCGHAFCVSCNSGTDALTLAATAMGIRK